MDHFQTQNGRGRKPEWEEALQPEREYKVPLLRAERTVACPVEGYRAGVNY